MLLTRKLYAADTLFVGQAYNLPVWQDIICMKYVGTVRLGAAGWTRAAAKAMTHHAIPTDLPLDNPPVPGEHVQTVSHKPMSHNES